MVQLCNLTPDELKLFPGCQVVSRHHSKSCSYTIAPIHDRDGRVVLRVYATAPLDYATSASRQWSLMMPLVAVVAVIGALK